MNLTISVDDIDKSRILRERSLHNIHQQHEYYIGSRSCPIAQALKREFPGMSAAANYEEARIYNGVHTVKTFRISATVHEHMMNWDNNWVFPAGVTLVLPEVG